MAAKKDVMKILYGSHSERGVKRQHNNDDYGKFPLEDNALSGNKGQLFLISDSKIRNPIGKNAGKMIIEAIQKNYFAYPSDDVAFSLQRAFDIANRTLYQYAVASGMHRKIGATCTALALTEKAAFFAHVGDCRIYRVNLRRVEQLTRDHIRVVPGKTPDAPAKPALTRAIGVKLGIKIDLARMPVQRDEYFVIASDGMNVIDPTEIQGIVLSSSPERAAEKLTEMARSRGSNDEITVQVIKVYQSIEENSVIAVAGLSNVNNRWSNWPVYFMLTLLTATMAFLVHEPFVEKATTLVTMKTAEERSENPPPLIDPQVLEDQQLQRARAYFNKGLWDEALKEYRAVLHNNPGSSEALDGIDMITRAYTVRGDKAFSQENWGAALAYYKKALQLSPENESLRKLTVRAQRSHYQSKVEEVALASAPQTLQYRDSKSTLNPESALQTLNVIGFAENQWNLAGLVENEDIRFSVQSLVILENLRIKKVFHQNKYQGVEVEVQTRRLKGSRNGKYGLIFGHDLSNDAPGERFFLFTVDSNGNYSLQRVTKHSVKILVSEPIKAGIIGNYDQIQLKVKSFGKLILLYANGVLLKMLPLNVEQSGGVGLYADPKMQVEFSGFRILPSSETAE